MEPMSSERMPLIEGVADENREYLSIKVDKMGHDIPEEELWQLNKWGRDRDLNPGRRDHNPPC